MKSNLFT